MLSRGRVALLALIILVTGQAIGVAAATPAAVADRPAQRDSTDTSFRVELEANGDARWTVRMNFSMATDARRAAFETFKTRFTSGVNSPTLTAFREANRQASAVTGRQMAIRNVERTTRRTNDTGQLVLRFTWTNFSRQTGDALHVDDVFNKTSGTWFSGLGTRQSLVIVPPEDYSLVNASPSGYKVSSGSLRWNGGETQFEPGELSVTYERSSEGPVPPPLPLSLLGTVGAVVGLGVVAILVVLITRTEGSLLSILAAGTDDDTESETRTETPAADQRATESARTEQQADEAVTDEELLSDEERIERLLSENGGRMKQANIVTETGWSNAKVSQLLSAMDEDGRIDKLRIGRENLISFPDEDITDMDDDQ